MCWVGDDAVHSQQGEAFIFWSKLARCAERLLDCMVAPYQTYASHSGECVSQHMWGVPVSV